MADIKRSTGSADYLFQRLAARKPANISLTGPNKKDARQWFRDTASKVTQVSAGPFIAKADADRALSYLDKRQIGQMFTFMYDAKLKKRLPYWDRFPLIFMIEQYGDGFLGINMHYLPTQMRATLMDALYRTISDNNSNDATKLLISYQILKSATKYRYFKPCVKRYLLSQVGSRFIRILPHEWDMALMLPTERFEKQRKAVVWQESIESIGED